MKRLALLALILALPACNTLPLVPEAPRVQPAASAPAAPAYTAPASLTDAPAPDVQLLPPGWSIKPLPPIIVGTPSLEVTAIPAVRSPGLGAQCSAVASQASDLSVWVRSANCGNAGTATVTLTLNGTTTRQKIGDQDLIVVQVISGVRVPVTAVIRVNGVQLWPLGHEFDKPVLAGYGAWSTKTN